MIIQVKRNFRKESKGQRSQKDRTVDMTKQGITKHNDVNIVNFQVLLHSCTTLT